MCGTSDNSGGSNDPPPPRQHVVTDRNGNPVTDSSGQAVRAGSDRPAPPVPVPTPPPPRPYSPPPIPVPTPPPPRPYSPPPIPVPTPPPPRPSSASSPVRDSSGSPVTDSSGRPVTSPPVTAERHHEQIHSNNEPDSSVSVAASPQDETRAVGGRHDNRRAFGDRRKTRLTIRRKNPSLAIGTKRYRGTTHF